MKRHNQFFVNLLLLAIVSNLIAGCGTNTYNLIRVRDMNMDVIEKRYMETETEVKSVGIYIDATPSIEGYIGWQIMGYDGDYPDAAPEQAEAYEELVPSTVFERCLKEIDSVIRSSIIKDSTGIRYYSADSTLWETKKNVLKEAEEYYFYQDSNNKEKGGGYAKVEGFPEGNGFGNPSISYAIKNTYKEDFAVVITDLYENEKNSDELIEQLKKIRERRKGRTSIELLGVKSEFAGRVYDIIGMPNQNYGVVGETEKPTRADIKFRPFYIILIGDKSKIELFTEKFYQNIDAESMQIEKAMFDDSQVYGLDYRNYAGHKSSNFLNIQASEIDIYNKEELTDIDLVEMERKKMGNQEKIYLYYDISSEFLRDYLKGKKREGLLPITIDDDTEERGWELGNWNAEWLQTLPYSITEEDFIGKNVKNAIKIDNFYVLEDMNQILVECSLYKNEIESGIYKFSGKISIDEKKQDDDWIHEWNSSSNTFEGEKTQNLNNYYDAIKSAFSTENQDIVCFSFYFRI